VGRVRSRGERRKRGRVVFNVEERKGRRLDPWCGVGG
jgi:hypothetical protein